MNPVVWLVQNSGLIDSLRSTGFTSIFHIEIWTSVMFSWSTFGLLVSGMQKKKTIPLPGGAELVKVAQT